MFDIEIQNFQSIAKARLTIDGFTALVGPSNRGKSAVLRALRAVLYNELHPSYIREGAKECTLRIHFPETAPHDVRTIEFVKGASKNAYTITMRDGSVRPYPKAGNETPPEVQALGFQRLTTEREETFNLNFQKQLETLFLVCDTPTTFTSFMQKVFQLERYERALRNMNADLIKVSREYDTLGLTLIDKKRALEDVSAQLRDKQAQHDQLDAALKAIDATEERLEHLLKAQAAFATIATHRQAVLQATGDLAIRRAISSALSEHLQTLTRATRLAAAATALRTLTAQHTATLRARAPLAAVQAGLTALLPTLSQVTRAQQAARELTALAVARHDLTRHTVRLAHAHTLSTQYVTALTALTELTARYAALIAHHTALSSATDKITRARAALARRQRLWPAFEPLETAATTHSRLIAARAALAALLNQRAALGETAVRAQHAVTIVATHIQTMRAAISTCPLCGSGLCATHTEAP